MSDNFFSSPVKLINSTQYETDRRNYHNAKAPRTRYFMEIFANYWKGKKYHLLVELRAAKRPLLNLVAFFLYLDNCTSFRALMNPPAGQIDVFEKTHLRIDRFIILSWRSGERVVVQIWRWRNICGNKWWSQLRHYIINQGYYIFIRT